MKHYLQLLSLVILSYGPVSAQVVINEIIPPNTVELKNLGAGTVNVSSYTLCQFPVYNQLSNISQICGGDLMMEGGSLIAVTVSININANDGEMALYFMNGSFENPGNMADYVEWGSTGHVRSPVAVAAGIWTTGDFVPAFTGCASLEYDGAGDASTDWVPQDVPTSPCVENSLDGCGGANCAIAGGGLSGVSCNDNGTPSDPSDDFISFSLNPTGVDLGTTYTVTVNMGSILPMNASYGAPTAFTLQNGSAGAGNVTVTITDDDDPSCTFMVLITDPGSCSDMCVISNSGLSGVFCNDAGTPTNGTDDFIMFNLDPTGLNIGSSYSIMVSSGSVMPTSANYGTLTTFEMNNGSAGNGDVTVTIVDDADGSCTTMVLIADPGTCSNDCDLTSAGLDDVACDDNGTPTDTDDFITFTLNPLGINLGSTYSVQVSNGSVMPTSASYGSPVFFSLNAGSAGGGNVTVTITDDNDLGCDIDVIISDPGACSVACSLSDIGLSDVGCDDNNTSSDSSDDFIVFNLNPTGVALGATYSVAVSSGSVNPTSGVYGAPSSFSLNNGSAGAGAVTVVVTDDTDPFCMISDLIVDPGTCSGTCNLVNAGLGAVTCDDNGTSTDPSDDIIVFNLNPLGTNLGPTYTVSVSMGSVVPDTAAYGVSTAFMLNPGSTGNGNVTLTITDTDDPACTIDVVITDPGSCSNGCELTEAGLNSIICNSNGSPVTSDDFISFNLNPSGAGLSAAYTVVVSSGTITPDTATYGVSTMFSLNAGSAGSGSVTVTLSDVNDPACSLTVMITDPGTCSEACALSDAGLADISCDDNMSGDEADDFITFTLNPTGSLLGTNYSVAVNIGTVAPANGAYGSAQAFALNPGSAGSGDVTVTVTDLTDTTCMTSVLLTDPGTCSVMPCEVSACDISTESETTICVDDGGDPDSIIVVCNPGAQGMNSAWIITDTTGVIQSITDFADTIALTFEGQSSGVCLIRIAVWDGVITGLNPGADVDSLAGCYDLSNPISVTKQTGTECATSVFNPSLSDLISLYPIPVTGMLHIEARDVTIEHVRIMDLLGRMVFSLDQVDPVEIDMGDLEMGLYYVMFETNLGWNLQRVVVGR